MDWFGFSDICPKLSVGPRYGSRDFCGKFRETGVDVWSLSHVPGLVPLVRVLVRFVVLPTFLFSKEFPPEP
jgi:hypothetical protein